MAESVDLVVQIDGVIEATHKLSRAEVHPGERVTVHVPLRVPSEPGRHVISFHLVRQKVGLFRDRGAPPLSVALEVERATEPRIARLRESARRINPWYYNPSAGIEVGADGHVFPFLVSRARGCHLWDLEGREYIDYIMGWGSTLLG